MCCICSSISLCRSDVYMQEIGEMGPKYTCLAMEGEAPACVKDWDEVVAWGGAPDTSVVWLSDVLLC